MVQCSRCRSQVDETTRKTCPACLTPLPAVAAPLQSSPPVSAMPSAIPLAAPKSQPLPPAQGTHYGASPMPGYAPPVPQNAPPAYAPPMPQGAPPPAYAPPPPPPAMPH